MIIDRVLGNLHELRAEEVEGLHRERVVLAGSELVRRIQRVTTDHGQELGLRLAAAPGKTGDLRDGDILFRDGQSMIVVSVLPTDVLVIAPRTLQEMGTVAHNLGNRHLQAQFFGADSEYQAEVMVIQYDHTAEDLLRHLAVPYSRQERIMPVPFRHAEHTH
jgi:urease accessory protein